MKNSFKTGLLFLTMVLYLLSCEKKMEKAETKEVIETPSLKNAFKANFHVGAALNDGHINETDTEAVKVITSQFNTTTPENIMKWMYIHPEPDKFYFDMADKYVAFGKKNNMNIVAHALLWHSQIAPFMEEVKDSTVMSNYIKNHINTIVGRYKGKVDAWDVVNEALNEDGSYRESNFYKVMGEDYLVQAFKLTAAVDPDADLIYNDYNLWKPEKRAGVVRLVKKLQAEGAKIDGIGLQGHYSLVGPGLKDIEDSILEYSALGLKVAFTELDITTLINPWDLEGAEVSQNFEQYENDPKMSPFPNGLPDSMQVKIADRYEDLFKLFLKHEEKINRVTFWGVNNGHSWLNDWPIKGRVNYPLLFDRKNKPQVAYQRVIDLKK